MFTGSFVLPRLAVHTLAPTEGTFDFSTLPRTQARRVLSETRPTRSSSVPQTGIVTGCGSLRLHSTYIHPISHIHFPQIIKSRSYGTYVKPDAPEKLSPPESFDYEEPNNTPPPDTCPGSYLVRRLYVAHTVVSALGLWACPRVITRVADC